MRRVASPSAGIHPFGRSGERDVTIATAGGNAETLPNDAVFAMIGREAPLDFFRRSGSHRRRDASGRWLASPCSSSSAAGSTTGNRAVRWRRCSRHATGSRSTCPNSCSRRRRIAAAAANPATLIGTLAISASGPSFWYTLAYSLIVDLRREADPPPAHALRHGADPDAHVDPGGAALPAARDHPAAARPPRAAAAGHRGRALPGR